MVTINSAITSVSISLKEWLHENDKIKKLSMAETMEITVVVHSD